VIQRRENSETWETAPVLARLIFTRHPDWGKQAAAGQDNRTNPSLSFRPDVDVFPREAMALTRVAGGVSGGATDSPFADHAGDACCAFRESEDTNTGSQGTGAGAAGRRMSKEFQVVEKLNLLGQRTRAREDASELRLNVTTAGVQVSQLMWRDAPSATAID
jgi:hypothetical protein